MTENKRYDVIYEKEPRGQVVTDDGIPCTARTCCTRLNRLTEKNKELKQENEYFKELLDKYEIETNDFDKFMNNREHTRLSINLETNELQRHIYATGNWFSDFDRVLVKQWLDEETYHRFIDRVIEVYNTEFKRSPKND